MIFGERCCGKTLLLKKALRKAFGIPELTLGGMPGIKVLVDTKNNKLLYYDENKQEWIKGD